MEQGTQKHHRLSREIIISIVALSMTVLIMVFYCAYPDIFREFSQLEYLGLFLIGLLAGSITIIPVPGLVAVFTLGSVLFPLLVGIVYSAGETIGAIPIYFEGYSGTGLIKKVNNRVVLKFEDWLKKRGVATIIFMSAVINPLYIPFTALAVFSNRKMSLKKQDS